jgi:anti-sigma B factor antagonist
MTGPDPAPRAYPLAISVRRAGAEVEVVADGELDLLTVYGLEGHVLSEAGPGDVVTLDLSATPFMDSTGLRVLLRLRQLAERSGWRLRVAGVQPQVQRMLSLAGADKLLGLQ